MDYNELRIVKGHWVAKEITPCRVIYQCSECRNVDDPKKKECSCCKAVMEVEE